MRFGDSALRVSVVCMRLQNTCAKNGAGDKNSRQLRDRMCATNLVGTV